MLFSYTNIYLKEGTMQDIVLIFNIRLTFIVSIILATFRENSNGYGHFGTKIQYFHFF